MSWSWIEFLAGVLVALPGGVLYVLAVRKERRIREQIAYRQNLMENIIMAEKSVRFQWAKWREEITEFEKRRRGF